MKIYRFKNKYLSVELQELRLNRLEEKNKGLLVMNPVADYQTCRVSAEMPLQLAEQIFNKIGEYLAEKTVIDIDMIIEQMTQQYEYEQKTNGTAPV